MLSLKCKYPLNRGATKVGFHCTCIYAYTCCGNVCISISMRALMIFGVNVSFFFLSNLMPFVFSHFHFSPYGVLVLNHLALLFYWNWNYVFSRIFLSTFFVVICFYASIFNCLDIVMASLLNGIYDIFFVFHDLCPWNFMSFISLSSFYFRDIWTDIWP